MGLQESRSRRGCDIVPSMGEQEHLALADEHIAKGREIVARQEQMICDLRSRGLDTSTAERTLALFVRTLEAFEHHRRAIVAALASTCREPADPPALPGP